MTSPIDKVQFGLQKLKSLGDNAASLAERDQTVKQLKKDLTFFNNIPPTLRPDPKECILAREVYEYATLVSVEKQDIQEFERNMSILRTYYDEFGNIIPESQKKYTILGLYLLYLLAYNKISEYHTQIELIPTQELGNVFIKVPVSLEQYFVEGSYNKILNSKQNVPHEAYNVFVNKFVDAIRVEIARSAEKSYENLRVQDLQKLLMITDQNELNNFIAQNNNKENIGWDVKEGRVHFRKEQKEMKEIPAHKMIDLTLGYATELNRII